VLEEHLGKFLTTPSHMVIRFPVHILNSVHLMHGRSGMKRKMKAYHYGMRSGLVGKGRKVEEHPI
jgi:hypothetical protein